jgi:tRNA threonylcarbamoyladenosine biosynthesis protein TsaE
LRHDDHRAHLHLAYAMAERARPAATSSAPLSQPDLEGWGRRVGEAAVADGAEAAVARRALPLVLALRGPLGAGKSVLARAVARGAGVPGSMPSPTYNLLFTYGGAGGVAVHHLDLYRLEDPDDVWELGWDELGEGAQIVLIEWPERAEPLLPSSRWDVHLEFGGDDPPGDDPPGGDNQRGDNQRGDDLPGDELRRRVRLVERGDPPSLPPLPKVAGAGPEAVGGGPGDGDGEEVGR